VARRSSRRYSATVRNACDVLVVGGGVAGFAAALAAASSGARVVLVHAAPGTTALTAGAWLGPLREELRSALAHAGSPFQPTPHPLPHPAGALVACDHAAAAHASPARIGEALVCGIAGLPGFHAPSLARLWAGTGPPPRHATLTLDGTPAGGWSPVSLAASLERDPSLLCRALEARAGDASHLVLPAVLGMADDAAVRNRLSAAAGVTVTEALALAPSLPGWRLHRSIARALESTGIDVHRGRASIVRSTRSRLEAIRVTGDDGDITIDARACVLATGKYAGGGIAAEQRFVESVLGMTVAVERFGRAFEDVEPVALTDPDANDAQPLLLAGVDPAAIAFDNVHLAGTVRAGLDASTWRIGDMAEDGWRAGAAAAGEAA
jgi:anaerobic glycerol-3-phosphate dehydrogenase